MSETTTKTKIPILSLKGGTGKTTTAIGIATALQRQGHNVGLLDVDIHASALPRAIGLQTEPGYQPQRGGKLQPVHFNGFEIFSIGLIFGETMANMWDGPTKASAVKQIVTTSINWSPDIEYIVVDTPPTSGDEVLSLLENMDDIRGGVIICQPNDLAILGIIKTLDVMRATGTPVAGILANMAGFKCPNCGEFSNPFDQQPADVQKVAEEFKVPYLGTIPFLPDGERAEVMNTITLKMLRSKPVTLKQEKGGLTRWALEKAWDLLK